MVFARRAICTLSVLMTSRALTACSSHTSELEARIRAQDRAIADLQQAVKALKTQPPQALLCTHMGDISVPENTEFTYVVPVEAGASTLRDGDAITIDEVRGTRPRFEVGGSYVVHGHYTLRTIDEATIALSTQTSTLGNCSTGGGGRNRAHVRLGSGTFELVAKIPFEGSPNIYFSTVKPGQVLTNADGHGGFLLGKTATIAERASTLSTVITK